MKISSILYTTIFMCLSPFLFCSTKETEEIPFDEMGFLPLHRAVFENNFAEATRLLSLGHSVNAKTKCGKTALHIAAGPAPTFEAKTPPLLLVELLMNSGAITDIYDSPQYKGVDSHTPLHVAVIHGRFDVVRFFIKKGVLVDQLTGKCQRSSLHLAIKEENEAMVRELLKHKPLLNLRDIYGYTPLILSCKNGTQAILERLITQGARRDIKDKYGRTALHHAAFKGLDSAVRFLLGLLEIKEKKKLLNEQDHFKHTALHKAIQLKHLTTVEILLDNKINALKLDRAGRKAWDHYPREERLALDKKGKEFRILEKLRFASHRYISNLVYRKFRKPRREKIG